ncbi:MAG: ATP synthase F0 subunit B [Bacillota bacterium]
MNIQHLIMAEEASQNLFDQISLQDILIIMVNVLILFAGMTYLMYKPVKKFIATRAGEIEKIVAENKMFQEEIKDSKVALNAEIERVKLEAGRMNQDALDFAEEKRAEIILEANKQKEKIIEVARDEALLEKTKVENEIKDIIAEVSVEVCESILKQKVTSSVDKGLIDEAIKEYENKK